MTVSAESLRTLHQIHLQRAALLDRLSLGPRQIANCRKYEVAGKEALEAAKDTLKKGRRSADKKQLQLKEREMRIEELRAKLNACNNNREYQSLKDQIAADLQANGVLEDEIFEALERNDAWESEVEEANSTLEKAESELSRITAEVDARREDLEAQLAVVEGKLSGAEEFLPEEMRVAYQRVAAARGPEALAAVEGEFCGGCFQKLTAQTQNQLRLDVILFCRQCGCLLYMDWEGSPP
jgi:predicted  nucleic acid-binding Zn-ribbon protein